MAEALERSEMLRAIEAVLMVADQPIPAATLAQVLECSADDVDKLCRGLAKELDDQQRGWQLIEVAGGWRFQSHPDLASYIESFVLQGQTARLSAAALETLAIVAYKQPISRVQVSAIRGVNVESVMNTLLQRGYIIEMGTDSGPGQAILYGTSSQFLEKLGINSLDELPDVSVFVPGAEVVEALEAGLRPDAALSE
jgi:segregation and condensation protein B